jgi:hypothetical protein
MGIGYGHTSILEFGIDGPVHFSSYRVTEA